VQYANTLLKDRVLFGSDYPLITPERWMKDFEEAGFKPEVMPGILKDNAVRCWAGAGVMRLAGGCAAAGAAALRAGYSPRTTYGPDCVGRPRTRTVPRSPTCPTATWPRAPCA
jgi:hypothetical protein